MYPLRKRLAVGLAIGCALVILGSGVLTVQRLQRRLVAEFDISLIATANALVALTDQEGSHIELDYVPEAFPAFHREERPDYFQFWLDDGLMLLRSERLEGDLPMPRLGLDESASRYGTGPDGRSLRWFERHYLPRGPDAILDPTERTPRAHGPAAGRTLRLVVARGTEGLEASLAELRWTVFGFGGLAVLLVVGLVWWALSLGFRPVERLARRVGRVDAENLDQVQHFSGRPPKEVASIATQLNELLGRLRSAFERQRRFAGHLAHELRTPIAELQSLAAAGERWPEDRDAVVEYFRDVHSIGGRMESMVADLLLLSRCQAGAETVEPTEVAGDQAVRRAWSAAAGGAPVPPSIAAIPTGLAWFTDGGKLQIVVDNLMRNAVAHTSDPGSIRCTLTARGGQLELALTNAAAGVPPTAVAQMREPFWRGDPARSGRDHLGLGLALATALTELLQFELTLTMHEDGVFRATLEGPRLQPDARAHRTA